MQLELLKSTRRLSLGVILTFGIYGWPEVGEAAPPSYVLIDTIPTTFEGTSFNVEFLTLTPDGQRIYALGRGSANGFIGIHVVVVDTAARQVTTVIDLGTGGLISGIASTPDGAQVYTTTSNPPHTPAAPDPVRIEAIDTSTNTSMGIATGGSIFGPNDVAVTPDGTRVYVTHLGEPVIHEVDTSTNNIVANIPVGTVQLFGIAVTPDGTRAYAADRVNQTVLVVDTDPASATFRTVIDSITKSPVGVAARTKVAISPDGRRAYVIHTGTSLVSVIDTDPTSATFHSEVTTISTTGGNDLPELTVTADGRAVLVPSLLTDELLVLDIGPTSPTFQTQSSATSLTPGSSQRAYKGQVLKCEFLISLLFIDHFTNRRVV